MLKLLTAITTYWNATSALVTDIGPIGLNEIPPGTSGAYVVMYPLASPTNWFYAGTKFTEPLIQFTLRDTDSLTGLTKIEAAIALLDDKVFTLSSGQNFRCERQGDPISEPTDPEPDENARPAFGWVVTYSLANT